MTSQPKINECHHFENNQGIKKLPRQIFSVLSKVPFKQFISKKNVIEFKKRTNAIRDCVVQTGPYQIH